MLWTGGHPAWHATVAGAAGAAGVAATTTHTQLAHIFFFFFGESILVSTSFFVAQVIPAPLSGEM